VKRKLIVAGALIALLVVVAALRRSAHPDDRIRWTNMVWQSATLSGNTIDHAALMFEGRQLDLGTYSSAKGPIGAEYFEHRILLLDFVKQRLAVLAKDAVLPDGADRGVEYLPLAFRYGHVLVNVLVDGQEAGDMMFDTGSSSIVLLTGRARWREWTGRRTDDANNVTLRGKSWSKQAVLVGAPLQGSLCVGSACLYHPLIWFESSGLPNLDFDKNSFVTSGLFGNVVFDGRYTVIVDIPGRRFGMLRGSL
jgi:hypothetical protein